MPIQESDGLYSVGYGEPAPQGLQGRGNRPGEQRRELRAGQPETCDQGATEPEPTQYIENYVGREINPSIELPESVQPELDVPANAPGADWRTTTRTVRVFDIANAGPRRRFTVSGKLVLNCVLGLGYSMGAPKFQLTLAKGALGGPPIHLELTEAQRIVNLYRRANYKIVQGWSICNRIIEEMAEGTCGSFKCIKWEAGMIWLPNGMSLKYPDLKKTTDSNGWDAWTYQSGDIRKKIYGGLLCENLVQALARIIVMDQMMQIAKKYRVVMTTHDEVVAMPKTAQAKTCFDYMMKCMTTAPAWCSDIPLNAEGGWAQNYSK